MSPRALKCCPCVKIYPGCLPNVIMPLPCVLKCPPCVKILTICVTMSPDPSQCPPCTVQGARWWTQCDDKWQALACCREIAAALRHDGPAEEYVSHLPVQQDGSCNGLQHYAALGRDTAGAHSVNLAPSDRPMDVYSDVVELVSGMRSAWPPYRKQF